MLKKIKAAVVAFLARPVVQTTVRHAVTAFVGVVVAAVAIGGTQAITTGLVVAAGAAGARVIWVAVQSYVAGGGSGS